VRSCKAACTAGTWLTSRASPWQIPKLSRIRIPAPHTTRVSAGSLLTEAIVPSRIGGLESIEAAENASRMQDHTETLQVGSKAPDFCLKAANRDGEFTLNGLLVWGALIVEFLRGTW
jgi:hypothetical protein